MFRVDLPLSGFSRISPRLAAVALAMSLAVSFGNVSMVEAKSAGNTWHKSGGHSVKSRHSRSRSYSRSRLGRNVKRHRGYRGHKSSRHLFAPHSLRDAHSSGVRLGRHNYRHSNRKYNRGHGRLAIINLNGSRVTSNYNRFYDLYNSDTTINGVSIYEKCPANFNCGQRAYNDDTGPRVITLGKSPRVATDSKKIGPPKVITLDKVN